MSSYLAARALRSQLSIATVDLFAGAGGLSLGATAAGADVRLHVDNDAPSCATLKRNSNLHSGDVLYGDVIELSGADLRARAGLSWNDPLLIIGGAPCQPFSKAAYWVDPGSDARYRRARANGEDTEQPSPPPLRPDARRSLVDDYWRLVISSRADGFVFENVPSLLHPRHRPVLDTLLERARLEGFNTRLVMANAAEYGVPQRRQRVFVLAARRRRPHEPQPTHSFEPMLHLSPVVTAGQALANVAADEFDEPEVLVRGRWAEHLREIPPGTNYKHHTAWAGHPNPSFVTETRFWTFLLKLHPDLPSWTVAANPGPWVGPFHWENRRLRTSELAALQGFPAGYIFEGSRRERVRQIGNAVPPPLARHMVEQVLEAMGGRVADQESPRQVLAG